jgi:ABC-type glycerol-3-phosphate transport system substrate-binding protein
MPSPHNVTHRDRLNPRRPLVLGLLLLTLGCPQGDPTDETGGDALPYAGTDVRVVVPAGLNLPSLWRPGFEDWAAQTSAAYSISEVDFGNPTSADSGWMDTLKQQSPTLILLPTPLVNRLVADGLAAAIPEPALEALGWNRLPPPLRDALGMRGDRPTVCPVTCPTLFAFYRKDLLDAAGRKPPQTWDDYDALVTSASEWAPGQTAIEPRGADTLATLFLARAAASAKRPTQYSFELDVSTGEPLIASAAFVRTLERMGALTSHLAPASQSASFEDCWNALRSGNAAIGITALTAWPAESADQPAPGGANRSDNAQFVFGPLPGSDSVSRRDPGETAAANGATLSRPVLCGFAGLSACVMKSAGEVEQAAAWDLWAALMGYQDEGVITRLPGVPAQPASISRAVRGAAPALPPDSQTSLEQTLSGNQYHAQLVAELPCTGRARLLATLSDALHESLQGGIPPADALAQAAAAWTAIIDDIGRQPVLNSYRQRRGLTPL